jgi:hypothetical protein
MPVISIQYENDPTIGSINIGITSDVVSLGTIYHYVSESATPPSAADLISGAGSAIFDSDAKDANANQTINVSGLSENTLYYVYFLHNDGANSNIVASAPFTTDERTTVSNPVVSNLTATSLTVSLDCVPTQAAGSEMYLTIDEPSNIATERWRITNGVNTSGGAALIAIPNQVLGAGSTLSLDNVDISSLTAGTDYQVALYISDANGNATNPDFLTTATFTATAGGGNGATITGVSSSAGADTVQLNSQLTITVDDTTGVAGVTANSVALTGVTIVDGTTVTATVGLGVASNIGSSVDIVVNNGDNSTGYAATVTLATGWSSVVLTATYADIDADSPFFGEAAFSALSVGDIYLYDNISGTLTVDGTLKPSFDPEISVATDVDGYFLDSSDSYNADASITTTTYQPAPNPVPVITGAASHNVNENSTFSADYTITELDGATPTLTGTDANLFSLADQGSGVWRLSLPAQDYEAPADANTDNVYAVTISADDTVNAAVTLSVTVTVDDVVGNLAPQIFGTGTHSVTENNALAYDYTIVNMDGETPTLSGADSSLFSLIGQGGDTWRLSLSAQDFEIPGDANFDNTYNVTITADDTNSSVTLDVSVTVTNFNDTVIADPGNTSLQYANGAAGLTHNDNALQTWLTSFTNSTANTLSLLANPLTELDSPYPITFSAADADDVVAQLIVTEAPSTVVDATPDQFFFTDQTALPLNTLTTATAVITGVDVGATLTATNGDLSNDNGVTWSSAVVYVDSQTLVRASVTTSASYSTAVSQTVTVNNVSNTFSATTLADTSSGSTTEVERKMSVVYTDRIIKVYQTRSSIPRFVHVAGEQWPYRIDFDDMVVNTGAQLTSVTWSTTGDGVIVNQRTEGNASIAAISTPTETSQTITATANIGNDIVMRVQFVLSVINVAAT